MTGRKIEYKAWSTLDIHIRADVQTCSCDFVFGAAFGDGILYEPHLADEATWNL